MPRKASTMDIHFLNNSSLSFGSSCWAPAPFQNKTMAQLHSAQLFSGDLWWTSLGSWGLTVAFQFSPKLSRPTFLFSLAFFSRWIWTRWTISLSPVLLMKVQCITWMVVKCQLLAHASSRIGGEPWWFEFLVRKNAANKTPKPQGFPLEIRDLLQMDPIFLGGIKMDR